MIVAMAVTVPMAMIVTVTAFVSMSFAVAVVTLVSMAASSVPVFIVTVIAMSVIIMPMRSSFFLLRNRAARVETDVGNNRKRHRLNGLLWH